ncbi:phage tail protein [Marinobacter nauticus]
MATFYTILTEVGQAKLANAVALGQTINITELAVGDGGGSLPTPETSRTTLVNEVRRAAINSIEVDAANSSWVVVEQVLPPEVGGWTIREIGIFDIDGDLIGYENYPETYKPILSEGSSRTQTVRFIMEVSDTASVTLKVDPSVVLATRKYADDGLANHESSRNHPSATEDDQGMLLLATLEKAIEGLDDNSSMSPKKVHAALKQFGLGYQAALTEVDANLYTTSGLFLTPASGHINFPSEGDNTRAPIIVVGGANFIGQILFQQKTGRLFYRTGVTNDLSTIAWQEISTSVGTSANQTTQIFTSSGTWNKPTGCKKVTVTVVSGGGAGGGAEVTGSGEHSVGSGGGGGGCSIKTIDVSSVSSVPVSVGEGGIASAGAAGGDGGASSFGAFVSVPGGTGGDIMFAATGSGVTLNVGLGGEGTGGDLNLKGSDGSGGFRDPSTHNHAGNGGASAGISGGGGRGILTGVGAGSADGHAGGNYGGGGGGAANSQSQTAKSGGPGAGGIVIVKEYY